MEISWDLDKYVGAYNFRLSIDGIAQEKSKIVAVSGVGSESKLVDSDTRIPLRGGGQNILSEVEITRVYQGYDQLYNWRLMIEEGIDSLRTVSIEILASDLDTVVRKIVLHNAWPHKWQLPNLDASSTAPAIETISLAYERITGSMGEASPGDAYVGGGTSDGSGPIAAGNAAGTALAASEADDSFWNQESDLTALEEQYNAALEQAVALNLGPLVFGTADGDAHSTLYVESTGSEDGAPIDPGTETWDAPESGDGITDNNKDNERAAQDESAGTGPIDPNDGESWDAPEAGDDTQDFRDNDTTEFKGEGEQDFRDNDDTKFEGDGITDNNKDNERAAQDESAGTGPIDPNEETWDAPEAGDGLNDNLKRGAEESSADGEGPVANTTADGKIQEFSDTGGGTGPVDPNDETWDAPEGGDETQNFRDNDLTEFKGEGEQDFRDNDDTQFKGTATEWADTSDDGKPIDPNEETWDAPEAVDDPTAARNGGDGTGPIGGRGEQNEADYGAGTGPIDNEAVDYGGSAAADDPTAAKNGGDGSGPVGGRGAQEAADGGEGSGPIDNEAVDYGGSAAADDPTAAKNGGDGSGPVGGRGAQAEADYGSPGDGPKGGRGEGGGGHTE